MARNFSGRVGLSLAVVMALAPVISGCTRNIPGDKNTGKDGRPKGAKKIRLEGGEGRTRDTVTYPGGDRVDWKEFEIPEGPDVRLRIRMKIRGPRPGHTVAAVLYDQNYRPLERTTRKAKRVKKMQVKRAKPGKYFLQVYAPRRRDAGDYRVEVRFKEREPGESDPCVENPDLPECDDDIPPPPTLAAIPEPDCRTNDDCKDGRTCQNNKCVLEDPCKDMTCPEGQVCQAQGTQGVCVESGEKPDCVMASLVKYQLSSSGAVIITLDQGKGAGIEQGWSGQVLLKNTGRPLSGGAFKVTKVTQRESIGKVRLSLDQLSANRRMKLCPN